VAWTRNRPIGLTYFDRDKAFPGYTLFSSVCGHHATLLDLDGRVVHQWHHREGIQHVKLIEGGHLLIQTLPPKDAGGAEKIGGSAGALIELDWDGNEVWLHRDVMMHHDYLRLDNGHHLYLAWDKLPVDLNERVQGGFRDPKDPDVMWGDVIKEITRDGDVVHEWRSWEHLSPDEDRICPLESRKEWTHGNSLALTNDGDWLISFRLTSTVAIIDRETGVFKWKWGPNQLSHQHTATQLPNGRILLFDNGCHRRGMPSFSRVVEVDPAANEIVWAHQDPTVLAFYSFMVSGCERLANGNTLITEGASGRLFEIAPDHETVWEYVSPWTLPSNFGPTPAVFRSFRIAPDDPRLAGKRLDAGDYAELNAAIAAGTVQREPEYPFEPTAKPLS
jgi:Arylsulfotransferase (ASST)